MFCSPDDEVTNKNLFTGQCSKTILARVSKNEVNITYIVERTSRHEVCPINYTLESLVYLTF